MYSKVVLRNKDKNGKATVYVQYIHNEESIRFPTGIKVLKEHFKDRKLTKGYDATTYRSDNAHIDTIHKKVEDIVKSYFLKYNVQPDRHYVHEEFFKSANERILSNKNFFEYFDEYIEFKKQFNSHNTIRNIQGCRNYLKRFEEETNYKLTFESITPKFINEYKLFSIKDKRQNSSIAHTIVFLKGFIKYCVQQGYTLEFSFPEFKIANKKSQNDVIALTKKELSKIKNLNLVDPGKDYVRDLFLLMCATSLRYSDVVRLDKTRIDGDFINTDVSKTKDRVRIPLNNLSRGILEKYDYKLRPIDLGYFNKTIKSICKEIESLSVEIHIIKHIGSKKETETKFKYDLIAAHTGRRSFITNCMAQGIPVSTIMKWSNHKKMDVFLRYIDKGVNEVEHMRKAFDF